MPFIIKITLIDDYIIMFHLTFPNTLIFFIRAVALILEIKIKKKKKMYSNSTRETAPLTLLSHHVCQVTN